MIPIVCMAVYYMFKCLFKNNLPESVKRQIPLFEHVFCVIGMRNPLDVLLVNISDLSGNIASF